MTLEDITVAMMQGGNVSAKDAVQEAHEIKAALKQDAQRQMLDGLDEEDLINRLITRHMRDEGDLEDIIESFRASFKSTQKHGWFELDRAKRAAQLAKSGGLPVNGLNDWLQS